MPATVNQEEQEIIELSHRELISIGRDAQKTAEAADLLYVNVSSEGITRVKKGKGFSYTYQGNVVKDKKLLDRIRRLVLPPAWKDVWICYHANGHIQATGIDVRGRKQYRYHPMWNALRDETKFYRLYEFGKALPKIRARVQDDLKRKDLCLEKVLALVVSLMERTAMRIGSSEYEKLYGSYGLTTLKDKHVAVNGTRMDFCFKGKKGVEHKVTFRNKRLANVVRACRDIPGKELFQYYDDDNNRKSIDSGTVNAYIREASGGMDFTAKDFRTWAGSLNALWAFKSIGDASNATDCKKKIVEALDEVSRKLGNTRTVCKKYYVHPEIIRMYEGNDLQQYLDRLDEIEEPKEDAMLTCSEQVLMKILRHKNQQQ